MKVEDSLWRRALPHRDGSEFLVTRDRLLAVGITPQDVLGVLEDLGDSLHTQEPSEPLRAALLWNELNSYLAYGQERAAFKRREAYAQLLEHMSLARLASLVGVSRQAVHQSVSSRSARAPYPSRLRSSESGAQGVD